MKKIGLLLVMIFLFTGCMAHRLELSEKKIVTLTYDKDIIQKSDYKQVLEILNKIDFHEVKKEEASKHQFMVHTKDEIYQFQITDDYIMYYKKNQKIYASKEVNEVKKLISEIEMITKKYHDDSFLSISMMESIDNKDTDLVVRIDKEDQYLKLTSKDPLRNFKIHRVEHKEKEYHDVDLLYEKKFISPDESVYIRVKLPENYGTIRISFETSYGYIYRTIPTYLKDKNKLHLDTTLEAKEI